MDAPSRGLVLRHLLSWAMTLCASAQLQAQATNCSVSFRATPDPALHASGNLKGWNIGLQFRVVATQANACASTKIVILDNPPNFAWKPPIPGGTRGPWLVYPTGSVNGAVDAQLCTVSAPFTSPKRLTVQVQQYLGTSNYVPVSQPLTLMVEPPSSTSPGPCGSTGSGGGGGGGEPPPPPPPPGGGSLFNEARSVFQHARCTTCHSGMAFPGAPHPTMVAGRPIGAADCATCHHHPTAGQPVLGSAVGAPVELAGSRPSWRMAPPGMRLTSTMSARDICVQVKNNVSGATDQAKAQAVADHVNTDDLVKWAFAPICAATTTTSGACTSRPAAPGSHMDFVRRLNDWARAGGGCP
jgi:hypothetical protein